MESKSEKVETDIKKIVESFGVIPKEAKRFMNPKYFFSKSQRGECKNEGCENPRRQSSAYCQECSDKYKKNGSTE